MKNIALIVIVILIGIFVVMKTRKTEAPYLEMPPASRDMQDRVPHYKDTYQGEPTGK